MLTAFDYLSHIPPVTGAFFIPLLQSVAYLGSRKGGGQRGGQRLRPKGTRKGEAKGEDKG